MVVSCQTITVPAACAPGWVCEPGFTGYKNDGCGHREADPVCLPAPPPPTGQYAAIDGSTPIGTAVCIKYPSFSDGPHTGVIQGGWQGYAYDVYDNVRGEVLQMPYKYLIIGACPVEVQYAAADGSTPNGTAVCIVSISTNATITGILISAYYPLKYQVQYPSVYSSTGIAIEYYYPGNLRFGVC